MSKIILFIFIQYLVVSAQAQTIRGIVTDTRKNPLPGANVYLKGSYDGASTDANGHYEIKTSLKGSQTLVISMIGYLNSETSINLETAKEYTINAALKEKNTQLNEVVITAGTFEAGDKKRGIQLQPLDILTTANSNGDIYGGLNTLPGAQLVGEEGALFVRGGEKNETKTFVDGLLVSNPYTSKVPDLPMRGRFTPTLFNGVSFSSGGYSAEYGQALSAALILQSYNFPTKSLTSLSFMPFAGGINRTWKGDSTSFSCSLNYFNMKPYYSLIRQDMTWDHAPEGLQSDMMFRKKIGKQGMLKSFGSFSTSRLKLNLNPFLYTDGNIHLGLDNNDFYVNTIYTGPIAKLWSIKTGFSLNYDDEFVTFDHFNVNTYNRVAQAKISFQNNITSRLLLKFGTEFNVQGYRQNYIQKDSAIDAKLSYSGTLSAGFAEIEWKVSPRLSARIGSRFEYSDLLHESRLSPRIAMAFRTSENSQISAAYGIFSQLPIDDYLKFKPLLSSEQATHYILNYQYEKNKRLMRIELFSKDYDKLVKYVALNDPDPSHYNSNGFGYARGMEIFLRDQKTFRYGDYWISYTFLDARKNYQDLPSLQRPYLFSKHSLNIVGKYFVQKLMTQFGITYQYASGRPYNIPGDIFSQDFTKDYHNLSANLSYLTNLFGWFTIVHFSVSNILGFDQVFGYHFIKQPDGKYLSYPVKPEAKRFVVLGIFITLDKNYISY